jgi:hypothetical protein
MNYQELNTKYLQIFDFISRNRIRDALDTLGLLCNHCRNRDLKAQLDEHADTYLNLLKYAFELNDDPQKEKVYNRLVKAVIGLADDVKEEIIRTSNLLNYYKLRIIPESLTDKVLSDTSRMVEQITLQKESAEDLNLQGVYATPGYKENIRSLFMVIWHSDKLKDTVIRMLEQISRADTIAWYDKCILVSALNLSLRRHFDSNKIGLLFSFYESGEKVRRVCKPGVVWHSDRRIITIL